MKKLILLNLIIFAFCLSAFAQEFEYGDPDELKLLTKIYIDTGADVENHNIIVKEIEKAKLSTLVFASAPAEAEIILMFRAGKTNVYRGSTSTPISGPAGTVTLSHIDMKNARTGKGLVSIQGKNNKSIPRILMNFESTQDRSGEKRPATKFAKEFIKEYRKANGLGK